VRRKPVIFVMLSVSFKDQTAAIETPPGKKASTLKIVSDKRQLNKM
jgi:hypothetical protein